MLQEHIACQVDHLKDAVVNEVQVSYQHSKVFSAGTDFRESVIYLIEGSKRFTVLLLRKTTGTGKCVTLQVILRFMGECSYRYVHY
jgi:hypothetical protein